MYISGNKYNLPNGTGGPGMRNRTRSSTFRRSPFSFHVKCLRATGSAITSRTIGPGYWLDSEVSELLCASGNVDSDSVEVYAAA